MLLLQQQHCCHGDSADERDRPGSVVIPLFIQFPYDLSETVNSRTAIADGLRSMHARIGVMP
jgi:hypothetical protein